MCNEVYIVNIDGLNSTNNFKISNPLSKKRGSKSHSNPTFSGQVLTQDARGNDVYKFNLPNAPEGTKIKLAVLTKDEKGDFKVFQDVETFPMPKGFESFVVNASKYQLDENNYLGYKFEVNGKEFTDKGVKADPGKNFTIAIPVQNANSTRPRQMEHVLVDSLNVKDPKAAKRNHFNMLGGKLSSVYDKIPEFKEFGIRNILGTPIFGQDNKSSHGYWTTNAYQITDNLGNYKDFKKLMVGLYQNGMSWTADGAFVNEGMEGIHVKDIMNWGTKSPFWAMFETKDLDNVPIRFGIFSKNDDVDKHTHIQLVNAPYKIVFEKTEDGHYKEAKVVRKSVDASKPTYIQVFDDRLASEEQMNGDSTFNVYANKNAKDKYEIANYKDSVQAYNFRVTVSDVEANYKKYKETRRMNKDVEFKNALTQWEKFSLVKSNKDGGVSLWVGNSDISKKRFVLPELALKSMNLKGDKKDEVVASQFQVQDDTVQIGKYWTGEVARILTEYTAKELSNKVNKDGMTYEQAVKELIDEGKLPENAKIITEKEEGQASPLDNILAISPVNGSRKYKLKQVKMPENITDGVMSYPFDAIEFSPDLMSVFAYPFIKNEAVSESTIGKSRYEMFQMGDEYYNQMPKRYRELYKKTDALLSNEMTDSAKSLMQALEEKTGKNLFEGDELTQEGKEIYSILAPDITKFLIVSALAPNIKPKDNAEMLEYDIQELKQVNLNSFNLQFQDSPESVASKLLLEIKNGLKKMPSDLKEQFVNQLSERISNVDSDAINVAKLIVERTESGLDWRIDASKDVGDWDAQYAGRFNPEKNADAILAFWNKFNKAVREYNPHSYTIGELTDWPINKAQFILKTGFTTLSDYENFYSSLAGAYGQDDEGQPRGSITNIISKAFSDGKYFDSGIIDNLNFSHRFVGNQDKPRILHLMAMDVMAFHDNKGKEVERVLRTGFEKTDDFKSLSSEYKEAILNGLHRLKEGLHTVDGELKKFDSENLGVRPLDFTIDDAIEEATVLNEGFKNYAENNQDAIAKLKANTLKTVLEPAMKKYRSILFAMAALPGTPTNYAGDEFGMTGWETYTKNEKQENRNAVRWDWLKDDNYKFIKEFRETLSHVMKIRNKEAASALVNGSTQPFHNQQIRGGGEAAAFYRYNDKTDAIVVLHSNGWGPSPEQAGSDAALDCIKLDGLGFTLPEGTIYVNALDENKKYKVCAGNVIKALDEHNNEINNIDLGNAGVILLRQNDFKGKTLSFKGRMENPNVKLANTRYNFHYMSR